MIFGIDVSEFQGRPTWSKVAGAGITFAIARVSDGPSHLDSSYDYNKTAIPAAGLVPGAYQYLRPGAGAAQADLFARLVDPNAIHALDIEYAGTLDVAGWVARYRTHFPTHPLLIYTGRDLWPRAVHGDGAHFGPLWVAGYRPNAYVPGSGSIAALWAKATTAGTSTGLPYGGWTSPVAMQFSDSVIVPGISGGVDGDAWLGTLDELHQLTGADVALTTDDLNKIAAAVWGAGFGTSPTCGVLLQRAAAPLDINALATAIVAKLPPGSGGTIDVAALAKATADELAARLAR